MRLVCIRCGVVLTDKRRKDDYCVDCRMKPAKTVPFGDDVCIPWRGEFDEDDNPLKFGRPYLEGVRTCQHRDCVNPNHLIAFD